MSEPIQKGSSYVYTAQLVTANKEESVDPELIYLRRLDELESLYEEEMEFKKDLQEMEIEIRKLEDSLLYFDKIPDFDALLCQCWFQQGVIDLEEDCVDSTLYTLEEEQALYDRLWPDCELHDLVQQDLHIFGFLQVFLLNL